MTRMGPRKTHCVRGHEVVVVGRTKSGNCKACARDRYKSQKKRTGSGVGHYAGPGFLSSHPESDVLFGRFASELLGDFYKLEEYDPGLTEPPHPYDPNRLAAWPGSGYGWPSEEGIVRLRVAVRDFVPTDLERRRARRLERRRAEEREEERRRAAREEWERDNPQLVARLQALAAMRVAI